MKLAATKNAKRNISFGLAYRIFQALSQFILRTCVIYLVGATYLGIDSLFASILQVLNMAEMGVGGAIIYSMYRPIAEDNTEEVCALLSFYRTLYRIIGIAILCFGLAFLPFLPKFIHGTVPDHLNLNVLYLIYLSNTVLTYLALAYRSSVLAVMQRNDLQNKASMISQGICITLQVGILFLWKNYYLYLLIMPACTLLHNFIIYYESTRNYPQYQPRGSISSAKRRDIFTRTFGIFISHLSTTTRNSFDSIFLSAFLGLVLTAVYNNYLYIILAVASMMRILVDSIRAGVGNNVALFTPDKNYQDMERMNFFYMLLSGWASTCIFCLIQPFMQLWVGKDYMLPFGSMCLFVLYFYLLRIGDIRTLYVNATGIWWELRYRAVLESVCNIALNYFLGRSMGLPGILLATIISLVLFNILYGSPFIFRLYFKNDHVSIYFLQHLLYAFAALFSCALCGSICFTFGHFPLQEPSTLQLLIQLLLRGIVCVIVPPCFYWLIFHRTKLYRASVPWFLDHFPKLRKFLAAFHPAAAE